MQLFLNDFLANNTESVTFVSLISINVHNYFTYSKYARAFRCSPFIGADKPSIPRVFSFMYLTNAELTAHIERITRLHSDIIKQLHNKGKINPKGIVLPFPVNFQKKEVANA